jgi:murein DD-endopeptidase MepM/ murein hydrolase activator NlpD
LTGDPLPSSTREEGPAPAGARRLYPLLRRRRVPLAIAALLLSLLGIAFYASIEYGRPGPWAKTQTQAPVTVQAPPPPQFTEVVGAIAPKQTITQALEEKGLPGELINRIVDSARPVYDLAKVNANRRFWIYYAEDGRFRDFRYTVDDERYLTVYHDLASDSLIPVLKNYPFDKRVETVSAVIEDSLVSSVMSIGEKDQLALDLADIFGSDIDFYTDIQNGDSYRVLIEKKYLDGQFVKYGFILAAAFTNQQKTLTGILFEDENGKPAYYAPDGKALKKSFLKSPLKFSARITSRFSGARLHPILRTVRPHLGVDYAAPLGSPVQSVGAGVVKSAGSNGASGKMVRIHHAGGYESMYLHLSRITVKAGARVSQGDIIGYVGSSGLSTGPHLDFRVAKNGRAVNPTKVIFPPGAPVAPDRLNQFAAVRDALMAQLNAE